MDNLEVATPGELADYDQLLAQSNVDLNQLVEIWKNTGLELPEHYRFVGFMQALHEHIRGDAVAELLAVAIKRLATNTNNTFDQKTQNAFEQEPKNP